ncbi:MAG: DUF3086 domain-containing protein [Oscillatoria sp. PMC 1068.18]|nr:DUF3086 domain-containing protein [Oscillatoria sp. PMC 1076.18]MEC4990562.1 DUF3086 domain-containing protein [Oscillatoria sp. PMC 1068.18]
MNSDEAQNKKPDLFSQQIDESTPKDKSDEAANLQGAKNLFGENISSIPAEEKLTDERQLKESSQRESQEEIPLNLEQQNIKKIASNQENSTATSSSESATNQFPLQLKLNADETSANSPNLAANNASDSEEETTQEATVAEFSITKEEESQEVKEIKSEIAELKRQKATLETEINNLQANKNQLIYEQGTEVGATLSKMVREGLQELERRKQALEITVEQLERRRDRVREEMRTSFAGVSQDLAIRVQGFKDYLVGSLQDLAAAAEQLELPSYEADDVWETSPQQASPATTNRDTAPTPAFAEQAFQDQTRQIRTILDQYRTLPDYYGPPWQLRRTFEPIHAEKVSTWFFSQGGRGAIKSMGSRLQNILLASATISVMRNMYSDRVRTLVLANTPERLGEWRRGLQDCLGISRSDFGPERGVVLFEYPEALVQKADRLLEQKKLPLIIVDEAEEVINLALLQFPLWLAFAADPQQMSTYMY